MKEVLMISGDIVFKIVDNVEIKVDTINGIDPTKLVKRGEIKKFGRESKNLWSHVEHFNNNNEFELHFLEMLTKLCENPENVHQLMETYEYVGITIYIRSDYGQIGWEFSPEMISMIAALGCEVSIDILSGGMVLDN
ncbi:DUF4279 domain-containing protein [Butyrivibrio sp. AE3009]|uniref:DUF4279 domain-containing protein n=1 Tax=Butyrivibrio sp. AE3009 TaxID=1280666 RepID=UPI0003B58522|nr:DUF4279 domain-containing protein [Butyrivibrio sp. AE3009]